MANDTRHLVDVPADVGRERKVADRHAMRRLIAGRGFDHAIDSVAQAVAVELVSSNGYDADERLEAMATQAEDAVLDALVHLARGAGWVGAG